MGIFVGTPDEMQRQGGMGGLGGFLQRPVVHDTVNAMFDSMISSPRSNWMANFGPAYANVQQGRQAGEERAAIEQVLVQSGIAPEEARALSANPQAAKIRLEQIESQRVSQQDEAQRTRTYQFLAQNDPELAQMVDAGLPMGEAWNLYVQKRNGGGQKLTDDQREYQQAVDQGFEGTFMDYLVKMKEAGRNQVNIDTGVKLPPGFQWIDPNNQDLGVKPIPGGPATQIPAELAARIGLAQDALTKLDGVEQAAREGRLTGVVDWAKGQAGRGEQGALGRELAAGAEALTRMLTSAGMNIAEAEREANLYLPRPLDNAETLANKVSQLKRRLQSTIEMAGRGRGLEETASGTVDYKAKYGLD